LLSILHAVAPFSSSITGGFTSLNVIWTGFDTLSTGLPFISNDAKSAEPKLVGQIDC
jgi:hypothetical protein